MTLEIATLIILSLSVLANIGLVVLINKIYQNVKLIDSPQNIVTNLESLSKEFLTFKKNIKKDTQANTAVIHSGVTEVKKQVEINSNQNIQILKTLQDRLSEILSLNLTKISEITESTSKQLSSLRDYASSQDQDIKRYREGYDYTILKKIAIPLISIIDKLEEAISNPEADNFFEEIKDRLLITLESHDIEPFEVEINADHKSIDQIDSYSQLQANIVDDKELNGLVHSVVLQPYIFRNGIECRSLRNGIIKINKFKEATE